MFCILGYRAFSILLCNAVVEINRKIIKQAEGVRKCFFGLDFFILSFQFRVSNEHDPM